MKARILSPSDLDKAVSLQDIVFDNLARQGQERFIIHRPASYFAEHIARPHSMIGMWEGDKLMAQVIVRNFDGRDDLQAYTGRELLPGQEDGQLVSALQGVIVHPDCRGQGLMNRMIEEWLASLKHSGIAHALSRIEVSHRSSWRNFIKGGFALTNIVMDARDGAHVYIAHKKVEKAVAYGQEIISCPAANIEEQITHMSTGGACVSYDQDAHSFTIAQSL